jgi:hypothetical protein
VGHLGKRLLALGSSQTAHEDQRLVALARFFGVQVEVCSPDSLRSLSPDNLQSSTCILATHIDTLRSYYPQQKPGDDFRRLIDGRFAALFIYGQEGSPEIDRFVANIADGALSGIRSSESRKTHFAIFQTPGDFCRQLSGQGITVEAEEPVSWFETKAGASGLEILMEADDRPVFVRLKRSACEIYLYAGRLPDLDKDVNAKTWLGHESLRVIPPVIFFRQYFFEYCWHNPRSTARLIIDDPLLRERYGFLDLTALQQSMQRFGYATSIAFIPWNSRRTSRRDASRFSNGNANLAICVHGCDHTYDEFATGSPAVLYAKAVLGLQRMEQQRRRLGLAFDDVMVFPGGRFWKAAIPGLRSANYLAAANSGCFPWDWAPNDLSVADFLWPAVTRFAGFPIFQRRYAKNLFGIAFDLFLGKPALIVEHHEYFQDRCKALEELVTRLHQMDPELFWPPLDLQLMQTHFRRRQDIGSWEIRFFTRRFQFQPGDGDSAVCHFSKHEPDASIVERVIVDGTSVPFGFDSELLRFDAELRPGQVHKIEILDRVLPAPPLYSFGLRHNARVTLRRFSSEFRDNTLSHHKSLLKVARKLAGVRGWQT